MAAKLNKRTIHYRAGEGEGAISPLKVTRLNPGKPKAVIRQSHYSLTLNVVCARVVLCSGVDVWTVIVCKRETKCVHPYRQMLNCPMRFCRGVI